MTANYHTHTSRCHHATGSDREYIEHAISHGMKILGFSDHCPWVFGDGYVSDIRMAPNELDGYFSSLQSLKKEYENDIKIYIGFESEYLPELMDAQQKLLADYPVDYMILGEHFLMREPFYVPQDAKKDPRIYLKRYVDLVIEGLETGLYKYAAHPDIARYPYDDKFYRSEMTRLCWYLKAHDMPVEINLLGLREGRDYPRSSFFRIAAEVGNTAIIGCDAHFPEALSDEEPMKKCREFARKHALTLIETVPGLEGNLE